MIYVKRLVLIYDGGHRVVSEFNPSQPFTSKKKLEDYRNALLDSPSVIAAHFTYEERE